MITDKMIEVIKAFQDGKKIQYKYIEDTYGYWGDCDPEPAWNFGEFSYRQKPEYETPKIDNLYQCIVRAEDGSFFLHQKLATHPIEVGDSHCGYPVVKQMFLGVLS